MAAAFDTLKYAEALNAAGINAAQAKAQAQALAEALRESTGEFATKTDLLELEYRLTERINVLDNRLTERINASDKNLAESINALDNRLGERISKVEADVRLLKWMVGFNLALTVAIFLLLLRGLP